MKKLTFALTVVLALAVAGHAGAALVTFNETYLGTSGDGTLLNLGSNRPYTFIFDLTATGIGANYYQRSTGGGKTAPTSDASGFLPADMTITSVTLYYSLNDSDWSRDSFAMSTGAADGSLSMADFTGANRLNLRGDQSFAYSFSATDYPWLSDGRLTVSVNSSDSIRLDQLRLEVQAQLADQAQPVPIPGAGWLFGAGLIGMVGIKRKTRE